MTRQYCEVTVEIETDGPGKTYRWCGLDRDGHTEHVTVHNGRIIRWVDTNVR